MLAEHCPENFLCQSLLLGAEIERVSGRSPEAQALYERAIEYAEQSGSLRHQALGNELGARFWRERKQSKVAVAYLDAARRAYGQWGAAAKVADLERRYGGSARDASAAPDTFGLASTTLAEVSSIDLATVMKAARVLAGEIELERLLEKLLALAIENAGAERGQLVLEHDDGTPRVHAEGSGEQVVVDLAGSPLSATEALPIVVVNHVRRTLDSLVLADASSDERYRHDPYVLRRHPRSVIVAPLVNQGRLLGIVYLENSLATGVFSRERLALIQVLASQAAIAIQNAQLYSGLKREVAERSRMESALRTISEGTGALTGLEFFRTVARLAAETLGSRYALIAEVVGAARDRVATLAFWRDGSFGDNVSYALAGTPCEAVVTGRTCHYPRGIQALFPADTDLHTLGAEGYLGVPLVGSAGTVVGHIALIHDRPLEPEPQDLARAPDLRHPRRHRAGAAAGRRGVAGKPGPLQYAGRNRSGGSVHQPSGRRLRLREPAVPRLHRDGRRGGPRVRLDRRAPSAGSGSHPGAVGRIHAHRARLRGRVPFPAVGWRVSLVPDPQYRHARSRRRHRAMVRRLYRRRRLQARRRGSPRGADGGRAAARPAPG